LGVNLGYFEFHFAVFKLYSVLIYSTGNGYLGGKKKAKILHYTVINYSSNNQTLVTLLNQSQVTIIPHWGLGPLIEDFKSLN